MPVNSKTDENQTPLLVTYAGSAGTSDIAGTSKTVGIGADPATGAMYVYNLGPAGSTSVAPNLPVVAGTPSDPGTPITVRLTDGTSFYNATGSGGGTTTQVTNGTIDLVTTLSNLTNGSVKVTAGTGIITSGSVAITAGTIGAGTLNTLGTISNILAGTIQNSGTVTGVGTVSGVGEIGTVDGVGGTVKVNVVAGGAGGGVAQTQVRDSTGTVWTDVGYAPGTTLYMPASVINGTINNSGTTTGVGVVSNLTNGSIVVTAGTVGTVSNVGTLNVGTINSGTINNGTLTLVTTVTNLTHGTTENSGTVTGVGVVSALTSGTVAVNTPGTITSGSIAVTAGTITSGSIVVTAGTVVQTTGTINSGTINAGTINTGTINVGTVYKGIGAPAAGSLTAAGTITVAGSQNDAIYWDVGGTWVGTAFFEGQVGTSAFFGVNVVTPQGVVGTQTIGNGDFLMPAAGLDNARLRVTYSSGTLTHNERASNFYSPTTYLMGGTVSNMGTLGTASGVGVVTTVTNVSNGTIQNSGTVTGVGVVSSITNGSIVVTAGTMIQTTGTINSGTINTGTINAGTINTGTINLGSVGGLGANAAATVGFPQTIAGMDSGGTAYTVLVDTTRRQHVVQQIGTLNSGTINAGTINSGTINSGTINTGTINAGTFTMTIGTLTAGTLNAGTINSGTMNAGTINSGTINAGTFRDDGRPSRNILSFGTTMTFSGSAFGTLVGSASIGSGTSLWVQDISIVNNGGTQKFGVMFGSAINGSAVLAKGQFGPQGGIEKSFTKPVNAGMTNTDLNAWAEGAGTADFVVSYFISV